MRILFISSNAWRKDNNFGNSYTSIFRNIPDIEIAHIYLESQAEEFDVVSSAFQITEKELLKNLKNKSCTVGKKVDKSNPLSAVTLNKKQNKLFDICRIFRFKFLFWGRDLIWSIGKWNTPELKNFINEFSPDIIFSPLERINYLNDVIYEIHNEYPIPLFVYTWDDIYTLKQFSLSPLCWIDKFIQRSKIRKVVKNSETLYVISEMQKKEYADIFNKECKILYKGFAFDEKPDYSHIKSNEKITISYTGNIGAGRWKTIYKIGRAIESKNLQKYFSLDVYSKTPLSKKMKSCFSSIECINFKGAVTYDKVINIQKKSDILLHIEPFDLKGKLTCRLSFSTKLVDYFHQAKCIFAVGPADVASMDYLIKNDAAITATHENEIEEKLKMIIENPSLIEEYGNKAWECGKNNHQIDKIQAMLKDDFTKKIFKNI